VVSVLVELVQAQALIFGSRAWVRSQHEELGGQRLSSLFIKTLETWSSGSRALFGLGIVVPLGPLHCFQYLQEAGEVSESLMDFGILRFESFDCRFNFVLTAESETFSWNLRCWLFGFEIMACLTFECSNRSCRVVPTRYAKWVSRVVSDDPWNCRVVSGAPTR